MVVSAQGWALIYLVQLIIPSLALGAVAVHLPRHLGGTRMSRFLIGFAVTPFLIAVWTLVLAAVLPGAPRFLFFTTPSAIALVPLVLYGGRALRRLFREWRRAHAACTNPVPVYYAYACVLVLILFAGSKLVVNARAPFTNRDVLAHLTISMPFVEARSVSAIPDFTATMEEVTLSQSHTYLYPAFLAQALMTTGSDAPGFPDDYAARAAIQMMILYMFLAVIALASTSGQMGAGPLALILLIPTFAIRMSFNCHRLPFQTIPLLLLVAVLSGLSARRLRHRLKVSHLVPCLGLTGFSLGAHTINIVIVPLLVFAWLIWVVLERAPLRRIAYVLGAVGVGASIAGLHYLKSYIDTGNPFGYGFTHYAFVGTPLLEAWQSIRGIHRIEDLTLFLRIAKAFGSNAFSLGIPGIAASVLAFGLWTRARGEKLIGTSFLMGLILVLGLLPLTELLNFGVVKLSDMFIINPRYIQYWYPFAAVCVALIVLRLNQKHILNGRTRLPIYAAAFLVLLYLVHTIYSLKANALISSLARFYGLQLLPFVALCAIIIVLGLNRRFRWRERGKLSGYAFFLLVGLLVVMAVASLATLLFTISMRHRLFFITAFLIVVELFLHPVSEGDGKGRLSMYVSPVLIVFLFLMTTVSWNSVNEWWVTDSWLAQIVQGGRGSGIRLGGTYRMEVIDEIRAISEKLPPQHRILHDERGIAYYLDNPTIYAFAYPAWGIVRAKDGNELRPLLDRASIRYILLGRPIEAFWGETVLLDYLSNPKNASIIGYGSGWRYYEILEHGDGSKPSGNVAPG